MQILSPTLEKERGLKCPLYFSRVAAGFPSPAEDYIENRLDLNELLISHPTATFFVRAEGESMRDAGIQSGDILVVDRAIEATNGKIVIAVVNGELTVKRLKIAQKKTSLLPDNPGFSPIEMSDGDELEVWGVVTAVIREV